jgi:hypothetical protein
LPVRAIRHNDLLVKEDADVTIEISALADTYARDKSIKKSKLEQYFR